jgi:WD40 repeat protein
VQPAACNEQARGRAAAGDRTLASGAYDGTVRLWNTITHRLDAILNGHGGRVYSVAFSLNGKTVATGSNDGKGAAVRRGHPPPGRHPERRRG